MCLRGKEPKRPMGACSPAGSREKRQNTIPVMFHETKTQQLTKQHCIRHPLLRYKIER
uniref:Uncharacterized protein n=1 Tax=Arundo donax TaxID=35708 RepID=A0A0A8ZEQ3_ARUDO